MSNNEWASLTPLMMLLVLAMMTTTTLANVREASARSAFLRSLDRRSGDGAVERGDLVAWNVRVNEKYPEAAAAASFGSFFAAHDANGDSRVSASEFVAVASSERAGYDASDDDSFKLQLHLSLTDGIGGMVVSWVTFVANKTQPMVRFHNSTVTRLAYGDTTTYDVGKFGGWHGFIHTVTLTGLAAGAQYQYAVSTDGGASWSASHSFTTRLPQGLATYPLARWAVLGDAGAYFPAGYSVMDGVLSDLKASGDYLGVMHVGDLAYATSLVGDSAEIELFWDYWCEVIAPVASRVPYMIAVGNHEDPYNFTSFMHRFQMPYVVAPPQGFYYSTLASGTLWVQIDTQHGTDELDAAQFAWLTSELKSAAADPTVHWIIVTGHRPQINSDTSEYSAHNPQTGQLFRTLEPLFRRFGVDLYLSGHQHMFEFVHPVALNGSVLQTPLPQYRGLTNVYVQPTGTVRVVQGTGGIFMFTESYVKPQPAWSWVRSDQYGFGRVTIHNSTLLQYEYVETSNGNQVNHAFFIAK
jgi:hypothetical protein